MTTKLYPCDPPKHLCRCRDFQPCPNDDMWCIHCPCPASYHSAKALKGKNYTRCFGSCSCHPPKPRAKQPRQPPRCIACGSVMRLRLNGPIVQVIPGQRDDSKRVVVRSPHYRCPTCGNQALVEPQGDRLCRAVNKKCFGMDARLVPRNTPYLPAIAAYLKGKGKKPL